MLGTALAIRIIRTIEYWDIEKKRYPQFDHCGVLIAEDITSRFLNVVSLFNGFIPLVALQLSLIQIGEAASLVFTKVLDEIPSVRRMTTTATTRWTAPTGSRGPA